MSELRIAALIMAGGASTRFGGCKHLADVDGQPMLLRAIHCVRELVTDTYVVTGAWHREISKALCHERRAGVTLVRNAEWQRGLGTAIATGVGALEAEYDGVLITLADQVAVTRKDIRALLSQFEGDNMACGVYAGSRGVPAIFGAQYFALLERLCGDQGARSILNTAEFPIAECEMLRAAIDIDTHQDLVRWHEN